MFSIKQFCQYLLLLSTVIFAYSSCSLNYSGQPDNETDIPELQFANVHFKRYEKNVLKSEFDAAQLEQYKNSDDSYARDVHFKTYSTDNTVDTEGSCEILAVHAKDNLYELFNNIHITNYPNMLTFQAKSLRWNSKTEELTGGKTDVVTISHNNITMEGQGFAASGISRSYQFTGKIDGYMENKDTQEQTAGEK